MKRFLAVVAAMFLATSALAAGRSPERRLAPGFTDNQICRECHRGEFDAWTGSHHRQAMRRASAQTVLGDFNDVAFTHAGVQSRFFKKAGKFFVNTEGKDGQHADFEIAYTFGVEPLQQYLIAFPGGRLQALSIAWDTQRKRWFHLYPDENSPPGDALHWTGSYQTWNIHCAECHSTNLQKGYDPAGNTYETTWSEINVSCQACHGPGSEHVAWGRRWQEGETSQASGKGLIVELKTASSRAQVDTCARCHSRRHRVSEEDRHGRRFLDDFMPATLREGLYHADGQILDEVYVYGSFLQSKMYQAGVRCSDCHDVHSLELKASGNALCIRCHGESPDPRFKGLKSKRYDAPSHHFHPVESAGAQCVGCHMPAKTYMVVDPRRDHSFRVPRPDLSVKLGTPNACSLCHQQEPPGWAAAKIADWYGEKPSTKPHYGETLAAGRSGRPRAESALVDLAMDANQPAIVRATAVELLQGYGPKGMQAIIGMLDDADPMLRAAAVGTLSRLPPARRAEFAAPLLDDPVRAVRVEAGRVLAPLPSDAFEPAQRAKLDQALSEYKAAQYAASDQPAAQLNLAVLHEGAGDVEAAERAYVKALSIDSRFLPARYNLANLYNRVGRNADAERILRAGIEHAPDEGELNYSLGLLLAEEQKNEQAAHYLGRAATLLPGRGRVQFNYALALMRIGRSAEAERALLDAARLSPSDADVLYTLTIHYVNLEHWDRAEEYALRLIRARPDDAGARRLLAQIKALQKYGVQ